MLLGGGADYRVSFDGAGMELVPALGRRASRTYPLRLTPESIRRGPCEVWRARSGARRRDGSTAMYDRGQGVTERWELRPDGVELSYRFEHRVGDAGPLVVRLRVETTLQATFDAGATPPLRFLAEGIGGVSIGAVTGIDDAGWRVRGALRYDGSHVELSLPASFVERATYPVVLDPLVGTDFLVANMSDNTNPDVAYDATKQRYLVCWQTRLASTSTEIRAQLVDVSGVPVGSLITVYRQASGHAINPTVASTAREHSPR